MTKKLKFALEWVENIVEVGENAGCFAGSLKVVIVWEMVNRFLHGSELPTSAADFFIESHK